VFPGQYKDDERGRAMSGIAEIWSAGCAPAVDGLYQFDGSARAVSVGGAGLPWFDLGAPIDLDAMMIEDPENLMEIDVCAQSELPNGIGYLCCGEGALGSQGFFAKLGVANDLRWIVSLRASNPFEHLVIHGTSASFFNNLGNSITIDLQDPNFV
jgi:hypothetical protein